MTTKPGTEPGEVRADAAYVAANWELLDAEGAGAIVSLCSMGPLTPAELQEFQDRVARANRR